MVQRRSEEKEVGCYLTYVWVVSFSEGSCQSWEVFEGKPPSSCVVEGAPLGLLGQGEGWQRGGWLRFPCWSLPEGYLETEEEPVKNPVNQDHSARFAIFIVFALLQRGSAAVLWFEGESLARSSRSRQEVWGIV